MTKPGIFRATLKAMKALPTWLHDQTFVTPKSGVLEASSNARRLSHNQVHEVDPADALLISSRIGDGPYYRLLLDLDVPVHVVTSSSGNTHLYVDVRMSKPDHDYVMRALRRAGVIQGGFAGAGVESSFGATLRPPWVKKGVDKTLSAQLQEVEEWL